MLLSNKKKIIFLHIPKTAGTSIAQAIRESIDANISGGKRTDWDFHTSIKSFEERIPDLNQYFIFSFVRNPWDRLYSWYAMLSNNNKNPITNNRFKQWLMKSKHDMSSSFPKQFHPVSAQCFSQCYYMEDAKGNNRVNFIGRFENLNDDYNKLCKTLKINNKRLMHMRKGNHKNYRDAYDNEMREFVAIHHKKDIDKFGYTF